MAVPIRLLALLLGCGLPAVVTAQALRCDLPARVPVPRPDLPSAEQPKRVLPIGSYTLAVTWSPEFCRGKKQGEGTRFQCGSANRFGFALHGLWPDGRGKDWPQYCAPARILPPAVIRANLCATPSAQLLQHEWAKHGTCMGRDPAAYFAQARRLYDPLRFPDMASLSRRPNLTAGQVATAFARANPGWRADMLRVTVNRRGWLDELWLCLDTRFQPRRCPAHQGGAAPGTRVKVWRGAAYQRSSSRS